MKIKTQYNASEFKKYRESNFSPSKTVPDQSLTVKQLLERFSRGMPLTGELTPVYNGDIDLPDFNTMDISEIHDLKQSVAKDIEDKRALLAESQKQFRIKEDENRRKKIIEDYEKQRSQRKPKTDDNESGQ